MDSKEKARVTELTALALKLGNPAEEAESMGRVLACMEAMEAAGETPLSVVKAEDCVVARKLGCPPPSEQAISVARIVAERCAVC